MMDELESVVSTRQLREAFGCFPSGVLAICARSGTTPVGMAASSFTSVSLEPPLVSVCIQNSSTTWPVLRSHARLGLSVLAEHQEHQCSLLARKTGDRFAGADWSETGDGAVFIHGATLWLDCSIHQEVPAGDHTLVLLKLHGLRAAIDAAPLVFHSSLYRRLATL